jgi:hypothetical protein
MRSSKSTRVYMRVCRDVSEHVRCHLGLELTSAQNAQDGIISRYSYNWGNPAFINRENEAINVRSDSIQRLNR